MLKADQRNSVALSFRTERSSPAREGPRSVAPMAKPAATDSPSDLPLEEAFVFYWTCTKRAGWAGVDDDEADGTSERARKPWNGPVKQQGCGFFRVLDLRREGRDCGVAPGLPIPRPAQPPRETQP